MWRAIFYIYILRHKWRKLEQVSVHYRKILQMDWRITEQINDYRIDTDLMNKLVDNLIEGNSFTNYQMINA